MKFSNYIKDGFLIQTLPECILLTKVDALKGVEGAVDDGIIKKIQNKLEDSKVSQIENGFQIKIGRMAFTVLYKSKAALPHLDLNVDLEYVNVDLEPLRKLVVLVPDHLSQSRPLYRSVLLNKKTAVKTNGTSLFVFKFQFPTSMCISTETAKQLLKFKMCKCAEVGDKVFFTNKDATKFAQVLKTETELEYKKFFEKRPTIQIKPPLLRELKLFDRDTTVRLEVIANNLLIRGTVEGSPMTITCDAVNTGDNCSAVQYAPDILPLCECKRIGILQKYIVFSNQESKGVVSRLTPEMRGG